MEVVRWVKEEKGREEKRVNDGLTRA